MVGIDLSPRLIETLASEYALKFESEIDASGRISTLARRCEVAIGAESKARREAMRLLLQTVAGAEVVAEGERQVLKFPKPTETFVRFINYAKEIAAHARYVLAPLRQMIDEHLVRVPENHNLQVLRGMLA